MISSNMDANMDANIDSSIFAPSCLMQSAKTSV